MNLVLGITTGIAAYKTPQLVRLLTKKGHKVKVILTENAKEFVTPLTLSTVSKNQVLTSFSSPEGDWHSHVELALWADTMLIVPATANTIVKMAHGICDNLLLATYFSAKAPVFIEEAEHDGVGVRTEQATHLVKADGTVPASPAHSGI